MPHTVTAWPYSPDPRTVQFSYLGYDNSQVAPERFLLRTTGALAPYDDLNSGALCLLVSDTGANTFYRSSDNAYSISKNGILPPKTTPVPHTIELIVSANKEPGVTYQASLFLLFPLPIEPRSIVLERLPPNGDLIPNPVEILPKNYLFTG